MMFPVTTSYYYRKHSSKCYRIRNKINMLVDGSNKHPALGVFKAVLG